MRCLGHAPESLPAKSATLVAAELIGQISRYQTIGNWVSVHGMRTPSWVKVAESRNMFPPKDYM